MMLLEPFLRGGLERRIEFFIKYGTIKKNHRVLDVGCGTGRISIPLVQTVNGLKVFGIDPSTRMLKRAKVKSKDCFWVRAQAQNIPFKRNTFDCAIMYLVYHHIPKDDRKSVGSEISRVLRNMRRLLIVSVSHPQLRKHYIEAHFPGLVEKDIERTPPVSGIISMMNDVGFKVVDIVRMKFKKKFESTNDLIRYVERKPYSTFALLSDQEFAEGLQDFKKYALNRYGRQKIIITYSLTMIVCEKQ